MGGSSVNVNNLSAVHQGSGGTATSGPPDVCMTPAPSGPPVPIPYVNLASSIDLAGGSTTTTIDGMPVALQGSMFAKSTGDEPGAIGGVASASVALDAKFFTFSANVCIEGKPVARFTDKMLMNHGNTACLAGEMQAPLPPSVPGVSSLDPAAPQACQFQRLTIKCGHDSRNYELDAEREPGSFLQVLASHKAEKLAVTFDGACSVHPYSGTGSCAKIHALGLNDKDEIKVAADNTIELPLRGDFSSFVNDWWRFLIRTFTGRALPTEMFTVWGTTCNGTRNAIYHSGEFALVEVFPNASWKGGFELGYKYEKKKGDEKNPGAALKALEEQGKWELKGSVEATCGDSTFKQEWSADGDGAKNDSNILSKGLFKGARSFINFLAKILRSISDFYATDLDIRWPCIKLSAEVALVEVEGKPLVEREGKLAIEFDKLLGLQFTIDILEWLMVVGGALVAGPAGTRFMKYLVDVKKKAEEGTYQHLTRQRPNEQAERRYNGMKIQEDKIPAGGKLKFGIDFTMGGDIYGSLGCKVSPSSGISLDGEKNRVGAGIDAQLEAFIKIEAKVWIIKSAAGVSMTVQGADGKSPSRVSGELMLTATSKKVGKNTRSEIGWGGELAYNGLAIYYAYYAEIALEGEVAAPSLDAQAPADPFKKNFKAKTEFKNASIKESKELCTLIKPHKYPNRDAAAGSAAGGALEKL